MRITKASNFAAAAIVAAALAGPAVSLAQGQGNSTGPANNSLTTMSGVQANTSMTEKYLTQELGDPKENAAYQNFHKVDADQPDKKIKLGDVYLAKYPKGRYARAVYEEQASTYYAKKDLPGFYATSEKGIALYPDDVHLLALSGWVIPRAFDSKDPDADKRLEKAEAYETQALDMLGKLVKPDGVTDQQFAEYKTGEANVAHSGLGMLYFRREDYEKSAKELEASTAGNAKADPTDLFVLGADLENTGKWKDAADAFNRCAQMPSSMQDNCKQQAANAAKHASE
jgi:hypothetical protein